MELLKNLLARLRSTAVLFLVGLLVIVYISFGVVYLQQGTQQSVYLKEIAKLNVILARPLPSVEKLRADNAAVNQALVPITEEVAFDIILEIAQKSGIDTTPELGKFVVPTPTFKPVTVGNSTYEAMSFTGIRVQGDYDRVMDFLASLENKTTLKTMLLVSVSLQDQEYVFTGDEADRRAEFRMVQNAVIQMMQDNRLSGIPHPISGAEASDNMSAFPDTTSTLAEKGFTGENATPRRGYVLYQHDRISTENTTLFTTVNYVSSPTTKFFYTCAGNGLVRQYDGPVIAQSKELLGSDEKTMDTVATVNVEIYSKPRAKTK